MSRPGVKLPTVFTYTDIDPVALQLGPLAVRWYGLMYLIGFGGGWWLSRLRVKKWGYPCSVAQLDDLVFYTALGVILGGRVGYMLFYGWADLVDNPLNIFRIWEGGMSFHGGLIGVCLAMILFGRKIGHTFYQVTDFIAPQVTIGLGAGRLGNFINGELWGAPTDVPWGVIVDGQARHASQLYEAGLEGIAMFAILWFYSATRPPTMAVSGMFAILYGVFRFGVEFVRLPDDHIGYLAFGWFTMGQLLTIPLIMWGIGMLYFAYKWNEQQPPPQPLTTKGK
jgi:phosphatidylglycerol:prolipoprotein diacylglycerol transferase